MKRSAVEVTEALTQLWEDLGVKPLAWVHGPGDTSILKGDLDSEDMKALADLERELVESLGWKFGDWQNRPGTYIWFGCVREALG